MTQQIEQSTQKTSSTATNAELIESVVIKGDISKLSAAERNHYYQEVCKSCGLNPLTRPFEYLVLNGKLTLYARKDATDQLRTIHKISVDQLDHEIRGEVYVVTIGVHNAEGRTDMATGAVSIANLKGDALCNAFMKAETKAKRRATLSICGLGLLDETELETIPETAKLDLPPIRDSYTRRPVPRHDPSTGEIDDEIPDYTPVVPAQVSVGNKPDIAGAPKPETDAGASAEFHARGGSGGGSNNTETADDRRVRFAYELKAAADEGEDALRRAWLLIPPSDRAGLIKVKDNLKVHAVEVDAAKLL